MKLLLYPILLLLTIHAAEVDKRFFSPDTKDVFVEEVLEKTKANPNKELAQLESTLLANIKALDSKEIAATYPIVDLSKKAILDLPTVEQVLDRIVSVKVERAESDKKIVQVGSKLDYTRTQILRMTLENKENLLSYQLQYTLYQLILNRENVKTQLLEAYETQSLKALQEHIKTIDTSAYDRLDKDMESLKQEVIDLQQKKIALSTRLEREQLLENSDTAKRLLQKEDILKKLEKSYHKSARTLLNKAILELALDRQEAFYSSLKASSVQIEMMDQATSVTDQVRAQLVKQLGKAHFGTASVAMMASKEGIDDSIDYFLGLLNRPLFVFNEKAISSANILKVLLILIMGITLAAFYRRHILNSSLNFIKTSPMAAKLTANLGYYLIVFVTFIIAISSIGIDLTSISMLASALAIGIGFGLQTVVSNMVAGIIMMFERSIRIGDFIEINELLRGTVTDMRIRSTVIKTFDNIDVVVPNSSFIQSNVINMTLDDKTRRVHIPFGVAYGTDVDMVQKSILDELEKSELNYFINVDEEKVPMVRMTGMNTSSVDYELLVWVEWGNKKRPSALPSDFLILIYKSLYKHGIEIPFPQLDLHVKDMYEPKVER